MYWPIRLETLSFRLINLETLNLLAYPFRESKDFTLLI